MIKRLLAAAGAALLLSGCNPLAVDSYSFEQKEFSRLTPNIAVVEHSSMDDLRNSFRRTGNDIETGRDLMAYSIITATHCEVHIVDPAVSYEPEWLGHEVAHCLYGRFHK